MVPVWYTPLQQLTSHCMAGSFWVGEILGQRLSTEAESTSWVCWAWGAKPVEKSCSFPPSLLKAPDSMCNKTTDSWLNYLSPPQNKLCTVFLLNHLRYRCITEELEEEIAEPVKTLPLGSFIGFGFDRLCCPPQGVPYTDFCQSSIVTAHDAGQCLLPAGANPPPPCSLR